MQEEQAIVEWWTKYLARVRVDGAIPVFFEVEETHRGPVVLCTMAVPDVHDPMRRTINVFHHERLPPTIPSTEQAALRYVTLWARWMYIHEMREWLLVDEQHADSPVEEH